MQCPYRIRQGVNAEHINRSCDLTCACKNLEEGGGEEVGGTAGETCLRVDVGGGVHLPGWLIQQAESEEHQVDKEKGV